MKIYVGNLSYDVTEDSLKQLFEAAGQVTSVTIIKDKFSGKSKGFGFVEMASDTEATSAISELNNKEVQGRKLSVSEARPRAEGDRGPRRQDSRRNSW